MLGKVLSGALFLMVLANVWIFSRFTVDDAFITWRYGKNLVEFGVWNYNPTTFDPTQAYTNPIYALLSIVPAFLGVNVVLFFKLLSVAIAVSFGVWFIRRRPAAKLPLLLFFAVPATIIHIFSGLETFLFVVLLFAVYIAVSENRVYLGLIATPILFLTRPESWLLVLLVPLAFNVVWVGKLRVNWKGLISHFLILVAVLGFYFALHYSMFHELLPNSFFVKSGRTFSFYYLTNLLFILLPLIPVWLVGYKKVTILALAFLVPVILNYSSSAMGMDYASRYAFHIYGPLALFVIYVLSDKARRAMLVSRLSSFGGNRLVSAVLIVISVGFIFPTFPQNQLSLANYYPRALEAHGRIGLLAKQSAHGIAMGDAGLAAYRSEIPNLDMLLLGTRMGTKDGITEKLFRDYGIDFVAFREHKKSVATVLPILKDLKLEKVCDVYYSPTYRFELWLPQKAKSALELCVASEKANNVDELTYLQGNLAKAPWSFWK